MTWEANAVQLAGLVKQVKARGLWDATLAHCEPATRAAFEAPHAARWHPGAVLADFSEALLKASDPKTVEAINYEMSRDSFGPILRPMVQVAMALTGRSPATILSRLPASVTSAVRNVACTWEATGKTSGVLALTYPEAISPNAVFAWRGAIRFAAELAGQPVREAKFEQVNGGRSLRFSLEW